MSHLSWKIGRRVAVAVPILGLALALIGCGSPALSSIQIIPGPGSQVLNVSGETAQYRAIGTYTRSKHPTKTKDITALVTWSSSDTSVASISNTGLVTAGNVHGQSIITASLNGFLGIITGESDVTVTGVSGTGGGGGGGGSLTAITIIPGTQNLQTVGETSQFIAIGTFSSGPTLDLTQEVAWKSSDVKVATIDASGLATGLSAGQTAITAIGTDGSGSVIIGQAQLAEQASLPGPQLATLTIYKVGDNKDSGTVTSADGLINCGPNSPTSKCTATYPITSPATQVILTATPGANGTFGGWSFNCVPDNANPCSVAVGDPSTGANTTVGAVFN